MLKKKRYFLFSSLLFALLIFSACSSPEVPATEVPVKAEQENVVPTSLPTAMVETEEPSPEPVKTEESENPEESENTDSEEENSAEEMSACVECHTDQTMLIDTAEPQEEVESENEGAG